MGSLTALIASYAASHLAGMLGTAAISKSGLGKIAFAGLRSYIGRRKERKAAKAAADLDEWLSKNGPVDKAGGSPK